MAAASPARRPAGLAGRAVALLAGALQVVAAFLPWDAAGTLGLDASLRGFQPGVEQPTVALLLVGLAALPALAALVGDAGWPRLLSGLLTAALGLLWLAAGPAGVAAGVGVALVAAAGHLVAGALATGPATAEGRRDREHAPAPAPPAADRPGDREHAPAPGPPAADRPRDGDQPLAPGFRHLPHTADAAFEAWGPTRAACFGQAVRALVAVFAEVEAAGATSRHEVQLGPDEDEQLLVDLLDEVVYLLDVDGAVPVGRELHDQPGGELHGHLDLAPVESVRPSGAVPKAITYHDLTVEAGPDGWRCRVTVDV